MWLNPIDEYLLNLNNYLYIYILKYLFFFHRSSDTSESGPLEAKRVKLTNEKVSLDEAQPTPSTNKNTEISSQPPLLQAFGKISSLKGKNALIFFIVQENSKEKVVVKHFFSEGGSKHASITNCLVYFICKNMRFFHIVEGQGFKKLMKEIVPAFKVPSSSYIETKLSEKYEACANVERSKIKNISDFCVTTNIWTETMSEKSFLGVTIHYIDGIKPVACNLAVRELKSNHTAQYIADSLREIFTDWNIELTKIRAIVTDNGNNMVAAAKLVVGEKNQLPCFAHTINLVVEVALENVHAKAVINKVREIVKWVKNSVINSDKLRLIQINKGVPEGSVKKFILDVKTRWNSVYYMIDRFVEMQSVCSELLNVDSRGLEMLSRSEMDTLK